MKNVVLRATVVIMVLLLLSGCGRSSSKYLNGLLQQPPDSDVTSSPHYEFSSFSGTVWKTKVKIAIIDSKTYTGEHALGFFPPEVFDSTNANYRPIQGMRMIAVLPLGTRLRIDRLMRDNGEWGGVWVTAMLDNATDSQKSIYLDPRLLAKNRFIWPGWSSSTNWGVNPDMLEAVTNTP